MTDEIAQELLSAYLDGELTSEEQARVEQRLAADAEYRQLHDELRALRSSLEILPRYRLHDDISRGVLRKAERAVLAGPSLNGARAALSTSPKPQDAHPSDQPTVERAGLRFPRGVRPWVWPSIVVAACLILMVFNPAREPAEQDVAKAPPRSQPQANDDGQAAPVKATQIAGGPKTALPLPEKSEPPVVSSPGESLAGKPTEKGATNDTAIPAPNKVDAVVGAEKVPVQRGQAADAQPIPRVADARKDDRTGDLVTSDGQAAKTKLELALQQADEIDKRNRGAMLLVECDVTAEAVRSAVFDKLLARQEIAFEAAAERAVEELDAIYVEATAGKVYIMFDEIKAQREHFLTFKFGLAPTATKQAERMMQKPNQGQPIPNPGLKEEARDAAARAAAAAKKQEAQVKPEAPASQAKADAPRWQSRAHRLKLTANAEPPKAPATATAEPSESVVRVLFLLRTVE